MNQFEGDFIIETDGVARGNGKRESGVGFVIFNAKTGKILREVGKPLTKKGMTNNEAEYLAVIHALKELEKLANPDSRARIRSDSELLVKQMNGDYQIKNANLKLLADEILKFKFHLSFVHIRREFNHRADRLANMGADAC